MFSNSKRVFTLMLLASAANTSFAAPAPVSDLSSTTTTAATPTSTSTSSKNSSETDIQRLERLLNNRNRVQLNMQQQIDDMSLEISDLRGQLEKNSYDMQQMLQRQRELFIELDKVRGEIRTAEVPIVAAEDTQSTGTFSSNVDEQTAYQNAVDLVLKERDYAGAIVALKQFQVDFPDSTFSSNAHYWLGQLYFAKKQDTDAVKSFAAVISYKDSNKRADALVKLGDLAKRNNNEAAAAKYYQQVVDEYPNSASAKLAEKNL
ncbi:tol-pal system protein YbgF [uncultured Vibrio sp.]|uniref:tol-pal system protein YbgF n=1 Tax=uncultured Vibrio sp. TaxID=114054 RepID=UPI00090F5C30|nr:tol-pal system protein YbgF [uncultured Vibrio sp.]OIQ26689.1 MAG: tol-pal system protein YbgF [Vibrio sp. MedPE-SWchi]